MLPDISKMVSNCVNTPAKNPFVNDTHFLPGKKELQAQPK